MKHFPVRSELISSVAHEPRTGLLQVRFKQGGAYQYGRVPEETFKAMLDADSLGSFFHQHIRGNGNFPVVKMPDQST